MRSVLLTRQVDIHRNGWADPCGGLSLYCREAQVGIAFSDPAQTDEMLHRLLNRAEAVLGEPIEVRQILETGQAETAELPADDIRRLVPSPRMPKKQTRKPKSTPEWKQREWGHGWNE